MARRTGIGRGMLQATSRPERKRMVSVLTLLVIGCAGDEPHADDVAAEAACAISPWTRWAAGDPDGACACSTDPVVDGWCALRAGDPSLAVERFGAAEGDDAEAGLAVALDLADDPVRAGTVAAGVLSRMPDYAFPAVDLRTEDLVALVARGALLDGAIPAYRAAVRSLGAEPPNPYDPDDWGEAATAIEASLAAIEVGR